MSELIDRFDAQSSLRERINSNLHDWDCLYEDFMEIDGILDRCTEKYGDWRALVTQLGGAPYPFMSHVQVTVSVHITFLRRKNTYELIRIVERERHD